MVARKFPLPISSLLPPFPSHFPFIMLDKTSVFSIGQRFEFKGQRKILEVRAWSLALGPGLHLKLTWLVEEHYVCPQHCLLCLPPKELEFNSV